jgi:xylan 1,4-beta-xylosidase
LISTHYYPTDAFGEIGADTETQLANARRGVMRAATGKKHVDRRFLTSSSLYEQT